MEYKEVVQIIDLLTKSRLNEDGKIYKFPQLLGKTFSDIEIVDLIRFSLVRRKTSDD